MTNIICDAQKALFQNINKILGDKFKIIIFRVAIHVIDSWQHRIPYFIYDVYKSRHNTKYLVSRRSVS